MACFSSGCWTKNRWVYTPPKSSILIGCSIIFTIHFGIPLFLETPIWPNGRIFYHQPRFPWNKGDFPYETIIWRWASILSIIPLPQLGFELTYLFLSSSSYPTSQPFLQNILLPRPHKKGRPTKNTHIFVPPQRKSQKGQAVRHPSSFMDSNSSTASASIQLP